MKVKAILRFQNEEREVIVVELGPAPEETVRAEAREEIKAYAGEGYRLVGYKIEEVRE